ncbi:siderophore-interacting protein [Yinghuangia seranimata]|uniref:siderophore-interacting protein n=1 Tax=Yinghuangia seranimata TaxID=408067 RepID=UPI00248C9B55|nr:siderophore-interacting protein [Yinghuangia seranimata]MDI2125359.1 siderophore-interacting protein [Yinghuangia seranimata]
MATPSTDRPDRDGPQGTTAEVVRVERITPHMIRVVLGGPGLAGFDPGSYTDAYVKLLFPAEGAVYPEPFDISRIRAELPREQWPRPRTYTVRRWDPVAGELSVDLVHHGDEGLAGPWAARVQPGDTAHLLGPGGGYSPDPQADWHLLAGDESALPAIAASLEQLPSGTRAFVFVEVSGADDEQKLDTAADADVTWIHRGAAQPGEPLVQALTAWEFPSGTPHAFVHGEAGAVKELRRLLLVERGVPRDRLSISGYWRLGKDDEGWRAIKRDWNRQVEAEQG